MAGGLLALGEGGGSRGMAVGGTTPLAAGSGLGKAGVHMHVSTCVAHGEGSACDAVRREAILGLALPIPYGHFVASFLRGTRLGD